MRPPSYATAIPTRSTAAVAPPAAGPTARPVRHVPRTCAAVEVADLDADGRVDLIHACTLDDSLQWHRGDAQGGFVEPGELLVAAGEPIIAFTIVDFDGDLLSDLALLHAADIAIAMAVSPGQVSGVETFALGPVDKGWAGNAILAADLDGEDGLPELIVHGGDGQSAHTYLLAGHYKCGFTTKGVLPYPEDLMPPRAGDFDGDGRPDLVFGHRLSGSRSGKIYFLESAP